MRKITEAIIHCTATRPEWMASNSAADKVAEIRRWHADPKPKGRGWRDIGYHYIIDRDGTVATGRPIGEDGAHVMGRNKGTIGVALIGGHGSSENDAFADHFTADQDTALRLLIGRLQAEYGFSAVSGHNQFSAKACPGFNAPRWLAHKPPARESAAQSKTVQAGGAAAAVGAAGGVFASIGKLDPVAQYIIIGGAVVIVALGLVIVRERLKHWAAGVR